MDWIDQLIDAIQDAISNNDGILKWTDQSGQIFKTRVESSLLELIQNNRLKLVGVGRDTFKEAMLLLSKQQDFDALVLIYEKLDTSDLVEQFKNDSAKLAELAKQIQENRDFWLAFLKQVIVKVACAGLAALI